MLTIQIALWYINLAVALDKAVRQQSRRRGRRELITEKQKMPDHNQKSSGIVPEKKNKITVDKHN